MCVSTYVYICMCAHVCTHTHTYTHSFSDSFHSRLLHIKYSSPCYMVGLCCSPILYIGSIMLCLVAQLCLTLCNPKDCSLAGSSVYGDSPGKNTGVHCHVLLQGIFPTQGWNPGFPHCGRILYHLSHQGSPN